MIGGPCFGTVFRIQNRGRPSLFLGEALRHHFQEGLLKPDLREESPRRTVEHLAPLEAIASQPEM